MSNSVLQKNCSLLKWFYCYFRSYTHTLTHHTYIYIHIYIYIYTNNYPSLFGPVGLGCKIHRLHLCRRVIPLATNKYPGYDTKQSDTGVPVMLEPWRMRSTPSLLSFPGQLWLGEVAPDKVLSMGQIELNCEFTVLYLNCVFMLNWIV